jgi:hypothetical protein
MEYNPGESWDDINECYHSGDEPDEEKKFSQFRLGAVFNEEDFEDGGKIVH